jgi:mannose-1-phosphate guanylyltransferase
LRHYILGSVGNQREAADRRHHPEELVNAWAIVLAGGEGTRLAAVTRAVHGRDVPKQFAYLGRARSLLQQTLDRIAAIIPAHRTIVVAPEAQAGLALSQLRGYRGLETVLQPSNRGTAAGVLLPLAHVLAREPEARVVVLPSDHSFRRVDLFRDAVRRALDATHEAPSGTVLIGAVADRPASDLGWIVPGAACGPAGIGARQLLRFVEKPPAPISGELLRQGALWNTLVIAAHGAELWRLVFRHVPALAAPFASYWRALGGGAADAVLHDIYEDLPPADISRHVLTAAHDVRVVEMADAGWCDCGTPERLLAALAPAEAARLQRQLGQARR